MQRDQYGHVILDPTNNPLNLGAGAGMSVVRSARPGPYDRAMPTSPTPGPRMGMSAPQLNAFKNSSGGNAQMAASMGHANFFGPSSGNGQWSSNGSIGVQSSGQASMMAGGPEHFGISGSMGGMQAVGRVNTGGGYLGSNNVNWGAGGGSVARPNGAVGGNVQAGGGAGGVNGGGNVGSQLQSSQDSANAANEARYQQLLQMSGQLSDVQGQREDRNLQYGLGRVDQHAISSGLGNTTVLPTLERGVQDDSNLRRQAISDQGLKTSMGIIERKTDQGPDTSLIASLAGRAGASSGIGGYAGAGGGAGAGTQYGPSSGIVSGPRRTGGSVQITSGGADPGSQSMVDGGSPGTSGPYNRNTGGYGWQGGQNGIGNSGGTPDNIAQILGNTEAIGGNPNQVYGGTAVDGQGNPLFQDSVGNWVNAQGEMVDAQGQQLGYA